MLEQYKSGKRIPYQKGKPDLNKRGNKNGNWRGGITGQDQTERTRIEFLLWTREVKRLNKKECVVCGCNKFLVAHHIKSFKDFPLLRYDPKNGIVVCRSCHPAIHRWGIKKVKKMGGANFKRNCLMCQKGFSFTLSRYKTAYYCSKNCHYSYRRKYSTWDKIKYRRNWYLKNRERILKNRKIT